MQDVNNKGNFRGWERVYEKSVLHFQFFCKLKTALKKTKHIKYEKSTILLFLLYHCFEESKTIVLQGVSFYICLIVCSWYYWLVSLSPQFKSRGSAGFRLNIFVKNTSETLWTSCCIIPESTCYQIAPLLVIWKLIFWLNLFLAKGPSFSLQ